MTQEKPRRAVACATVSARAMDAIAAVTSVTVVLCREFSRERTAEGDAIEEDTDLALDDLEVFSSG